MRFAYAEL